MSKPINIEGTLYRYIPGFSDNYVISKNGELYSFILGGPMKTYRTPRGYQRVSIFLATGRAVTRYIHRLIMKAWDYPVNGDPRLLNVVYKNGVIGDDRFENLKWVPYVGITATYKTQPGEMRAVEVRNVKTGKVTAFPDAYAAAVAYGFHPTSAGYRCRYPVPRVWPDNTQWRYVTDKPWPELTKQDIENDKDHYMRRKPVEIFDVFTGKVTRYESLGDAARIRNTTANCLYRRIAREGSPTFTEGYQIRYVDDPTPWHICDDYFLHIEDSTHNRKMFIAVDEAKKEVWITTNARELSRTFNVGYHVLLQRVLRSMPGSPLLRKGNNFDGIMIYYYRQWCRVYSVSDYRVNFV